MSDYMGDGVIKPRRVAGNCKDKEVCKLSVGHGVFCKVYIFLNKIII